MTVEEKFKKLTGETDESLVSLFLSKAEIKVLEKTNRVEMIAELESFKLDLAVARYERDGESGSSSHSEGGVSRSYRSEDEILSGIDKYRLSAVARRRLNAKKKDEEIQTQKIYRKKDTERNTALEYLDPVAGEAVIWPAGGKVQAELYGLRLAYMLNMNYYGDLNISENDAICINIDEPEYKVVSIKSYPKFKFIELEN